jgi:hypothetical protein
MSANVADFAVPDDALSHIRLAQAVLNHVDGMPQGSVIAVQGPWGRGKTDVLRRLQAQVTARMDKSALEPLWINPWQYGTPDLLTPLVTQLITRMKPSSDHRETVKQNASTLIRAANAIAFKGLKLVVPAGDVLEPGGKAVDDFIKYLFDPQKSADDRRDRDPIAAMAQRFAELVALYLKEKNIVYEKLIICIDDLDRCLPDHQVAMLEALHFLTASRPKATFVVAIDPTLVRQAAISHYNTAGFDTDQYLNKLFDLRINLPQISSGDLSTLVHALLATVTVQKPAHTKLGDFLTAAATDIDSKALEDLVRIFIYPELRNPRLINKVFYKLAFLAAFMTEDNGLPIDAKNLRACLVWLAAAERWPELRGMLQNFSDTDWPKIMNGIAEHYRDATDSAKKQYPLSEAITSRLPDKATHKDVSEFFTMDVMRYKNTDTLYKVDDLMIRLGL